MVPWPPRADLGCAGVQAAVTGQDQRPSSWTRIDLFDFDADITVSAPIGAVESNGHYDALIRSAG